MHHVQEAKSQRSTWALTKGSNTAAIAESIGLARGSRGFLLDAQTLRASSALHKKLYYMLAQLAPVVDDSVVTKCLASVIKSAPEEQQRVCPIRGRPANRVAQEWNEELRGFIRLLRAL